MKKKIFSLFLVFVIIISLIPIVQIKDSNASVGVGINKKAVTLFVNQKYQLKLSGTKLKSVASSNKKVVIVNSKGLIKGIKAGKAIVSLKGANNKIYKCSVTVKNPYISKTSISLIKGKSYTLKLYGTSIKSVSTSNKKVVTISKSGTIKGVEKGSCYVYIKGINNKVYKCKVIVELHKHKWIKTDETDATCFVPKYIYYKCSTCKQTKKVSVGKKLEHKWSDRTKTADASCQHGAHYRYICSLCDCSKYTYEGETVDHKWIEMCKTNKAIYYYCEWCNESKIIDLN